MELRRRVGALGPVADFAALDPARRGVELGVGQRRRAVMAGGAHRRGGRREGAIDVAGAEGNSMIVRGGLSPGQIVVTAGVHVLTPGQKVKLYSEPASVAAVKR